MKKSILFILSVILCCLSIATCSGLSMESNAEEVSSMKEQAAMKAVAWLKSQQTEGGYWGDSRNVNSTCDVLEVLRMYEESYTNEKALLWLSEKNIDNNNDSLSRYIRAIGDTQKEQYLLDTGNWDGGFGLTKRYASNVLDTLLVLETFKNHSDYEDEIWGMIYYLLGKQNEDGGWSITEKSESDMILTLRIGYAMESFLRKNHLKSQTIEESLEKINNFMSSIDERDFSAEQFEKTLNYNLYYEKQQYLVSEESLQTVEQLIMSQQENGSFHNNIKDTVLALKYMYDLNTKECITCQITDMKVELNVNRTYIDNPMEVLAKTTISYYANIEKPFSLRTVILDGENILYEEHQEVTVLPDVQEVEAEAVPFSVLESKPKDLVILVELYDKEEKISEAKTYFEVCDRKIKTDVLLIQDVAPWSSAANIQVLNRMGVSYDKATSQQALNINFLKYRLVIVANDQKDTFYRNISKVTDEFTSFVSNGGTLVYGVCDSGWSNGISDIVIPANIKIGPVTFKNNNYIVDKEHPIVTATLSDNIPLTDSQIVSNYASHRYVEPASLPENSNIILNGGSNELPTLVECKIKKGTIIVSCLTWEHNYEHWSNRFGAKALDDLFLYAYNITMNAIDEDDIGEISSTIRTDKEEYHFGEEVSIEVETTLSSFERTATQRIEILDEKEKKVAVLEEGIEQHLVVGNDLQSQYQWNIQDVLTGKYIVRVSWMEEEKLISSSEKEFMVVSDVDISNQITTNGTEFYAGQEILVEQIIENNGTNHIEEASVNEITVYNEMEEVMEVETREIEQLLPGTRKEIYKTLKTDGYQPGEYKIIAELKREDESIVKAETVFVILEKGIEDIALQGKLSVDKTNSDAPIFQYKIENVGKKDLENATVNMKILTDNEEILMDTVSIAVSIKSGDKIEGITVYDAKGLENGNYVVLLETVTLEGAVYRLDIGGFCVESNGIFELESGLYSLGDKELTVRTSEARITGTIHSNDNFVFSGSTLEHIGALNAVKKVITYGNDITLGEVVENSDVLQISDYGQEIRNLIGTDTTEQETIAYYQDIIVDVPLLSKKDINFYCGTVKINESILAEGNICFGTSNLMIGEKEPIVVASLNGNIHLNSSYIDANCIFYAPNGTVYINMSQMDLAGTVIAKEIQIAGSKFTLK